MSDRHPSAMPILYAALAGAFPPVHLSARTRIWLAVLALSIVGYILLTIYELVRGPIALRKMRPANAVATRMIPIAADETVQPEELARFLRDTRGILERAGFNQLALMRGANVAGYVALASDAAGVVATTLAMPRKDGGVTSLVGFTTQLASGAQVKTSNSANESPWPSRRGDDVVRFAAEQDVVRLLALHRARVTKRTAKGARIVPIAIKDPVGWQFNEESASLERAVSSGYYYRDGSQMRLTWKGACLNAWRRSHPFREMRESSAERAHRSLLREIGVRV